MAAGGASVMNDRQTQSDAAAVAQALMQNAHRRGRAVDIMRLCDHIVGVIPEISAGVRGRRGDLTRLLYGKGIDAVHEPADAEIGIAAVIGKSVDEALENIVGAVKARLSRPSGVGQHIGRRRRPAEVIVAVAGGTHLFGVDKAQIGQLKVSAFGVILDDLILDLFDLVRGQTDEVDLLCSFGDGEIRGEIAALCIGGDSGNLRLLDGQDRLVLDQQLIATQIAHLLSIGSIRQYDLSAAIGGRDRNDRVVALSSQGSHRA